MILDVSKFTGQKAKKGMKRRYISIVGVHLCNIKMYLRMVNSFLVFKRIIYESFLESYKCD